VRSLEPNIVVVNMGLHWLHFYGHGRNTKGLPVHAWVNYEAWLETALEQSVSAGAKTILFKTTNFIREKKYEKAHRTSNALCRQKDNMTLAMCNELAFEEGKPHQLTRDNITNHCELGLFNENGASHLNERLFVFAKSLPEMPGVKIGIFLMTTMWNSVSTRGMPITVTKASCFDYDCWGIRFNAWPLLVKNKMLTPSFTINPCT
jgi:hypothetical protein